MNKLLQAALKYRNDLNYSVIPVRKDKKPYIAWEQWQKEIASEAQIRSWWEKWPEANVGVVTGAVSNLTVIDIDTDEGKKAILEYLPDSLTAPTATTPSGGQHIYFTCPDGNINNNARIIPGCDLRANGGYVVASPSINGDGKSYAWLQGLRPIDIETPALPEKYIEYIQKNNVYGREEVNPNNVTNVTNVTNNNFIEGRRDEDIFHTANCLIKGGMTPEMTSQVLNIIGKNCDPPFSQKEILTKIESALKRDSARNINIGHEIRVWVELQSGYFFVTESYKELRLLLPQQMAAVRAVFFRMCKEGVIESVGKRSGQYRKIDKNLNKLNWYNADAQNFYPIKYPFGIEDLARTFPRNVVVIGGHKETGKTAFLANTAVMNMHHLRVRYLSSDVGETEFKDRMVNISKELHIPLEEMRDNIEVLDRVSDFADVILPEALNIIDHLLILDDFFLVGKMIEAIYQRLTTGVAVIGIQKPEGRKTPLGGDRALEKCRICVALDPGNPNTAEIVVGKNWTNREENPVGLKLGYKLIQGAKFLQTTPWQKEGR